MKKKAILISVIGFLALLLYITLHIIIRKAADNPAIDVSVRDFAYQIRGEKGGFFYWLTRITTEFGYAYCIVAFGVLLLIYTRFDGRFICFILIMVLEFVLNTVLKSMVDRVRPMQSMWWMVEKSSSFPSGHSTSAGAMYTFFIYFFLTDKMDKKYKIPFVIGSAFLMLWVPFTRIILGMHYFTDVCAGIALGVFSASLGIGLHMVMQKYDFMDEGVIQFRKK